MSGDLDPRLNAYRPDLADARLRGRVQAERFVDGLAMRVTVSSTDLSRTPSDTSGLDCQILQGHDVLVFETIDRWSWCQTEADGYVGYVRSETLSPPKAALTHYVTAPRTFLYPKPDLKVPQIDACSMGAYLGVISVETVRGTSYAILESGEAVFAGHIAPLGDWQSDYVAVAETLLNTPYLWAGNTGFGIDCSGLVQLAMACCGRTVLRDSDMQVLSIGTEIEGDLTALQRGDLVFWNGHVGIMKDRQTLLHANAHTMTVALEPLISAVERIGYLYGQPTRFRRPEKLG